MIGIIHKSRDFSCNDIFLFPRKLLSCYALCLAAQVFFFWKISHWFGFDLFSEECKGSKLNKFGTGNLHPFPPESTWSIMEQIPAPTIKALLNILPAFSTLHYYFL